MPPAVARLRLSARPLRDVFHRILALVAVGLAADAPAAPAATFGVFRSVDGGRTWTAAGAGLPADLRTDALGRSGPRRLAGTERGVYVSDDDGLTWSRPARGVPETLKVFDFVVAAGQVHAATARGVWHSSDHGQTWAAAAAPLDRLRILSLAAVGDTLVVGTDGHGAYLRRSADGAWSAQGDGLPPRAQLFQLAVSRGEVYAALYARGVYRFDAATGRWIEPGAEQPLRLVALDGTLFAGRNPGGVFTSADGGRAWSETSAGLAPHAPTSALAATDRAALLATTGTATVMRFERGAKSWQASDAGLPPAATAIAFGTGAPALLVAVIFRG